MGGTMKSSDGLGDEKDTKALRTCVTISAHMAMVERLPQGSQTRNLLFEDEGPSCPWILLINESDTTYLSVKGIDS
ncbi:hypothetical protein GOP47_0008168 [Adiantum capillus-veneris]|uniref:Uncharacterized protein n=1 Tax=Adiantum capillus-veneris TaxID=13818 RepID=A0A9D4ZHT2_ADICA|nr:hypothetical protein GOP47_0008168 [Adiantum capillus-veneris]